MKNKILHNDPRDFVNQRCGHNFPIAECPYEFCLAKKITSELSEAHTEITRLRTQMELPDLPFIYGSLDNLRERYAQGLPHDLWAHDIKLLLEKLDKPNPPPEADAMELACTLLDELGIPTAVNDTVNRERIRNLASALTEYGDQRAHAAHMAAYREGLECLAEERKRSNQRDAKAEADRLERDHILYAEGRAAGYTQTEAQRIIEEAAALLLTNEKYIEARDNLAREARTAAIEEAHLAVSVLNFEGIAKLMVLQAIRALADHRIEPTETLPDGSKFRQQDV